MMKAKPAAIAALFLLAACGNSPIMNHVTDDKTTPASDTNGRNAAPTAQTPTDECPLEFPKSGLCASFVWDKDMPNRKIKNNTGVLRFWTKGQSAEGPFIEPKSAVGILVWMPSMGHGSGEPPEETVEATEPGVYAASKIRFIMGGYWDLHIQLKDGEKVIEEALVPIQF